MKNFSLPADYRPYIDKYFLRAKTVLKTEGLNPIVKAQVFIRKGGVKVYGLDEAIAILTKYSDIEKTGKIYALKEGDYFESCETFMTIEAPIQSIIALETMYLGVLSAETTLKNWGGAQLLPSRVMENMEKIVKLVAPRPVSYFGARHWRYDMDFLIASACCAAGAVNCSTDAGASAFKPPFDKGIGTIPHALEAIYDYRWGPNDAVVEATKAFDKHIDKKIPRIALVDYANHEVWDSVMTAQQVPNLYGIRIDTCGENVMEENYAIDLKSQPYWFGKGVKIGGVLRIRQALFEAGFEKVKIILSSGFGDPKKVEAFIKAEKELRIKLFDGLGVGGVFPARMATMDIIEIDNEEVHKTGREARPNERLKRVL